MAARRSYPLPKVKAGGREGLEELLQRAGSAPRLLLYYRSEEHQHRAPGIPDRFSAAADAAHNKIGRAHV